MNAIERLRALEAEAVRGPWGAGGLIVCDDPDSPHCWHTFNRQVEIFPPLVPVGEPQPSGPIALVSSAESAALVVAARNALPALLAVAEAAAAQPGYNKKALRDALAELDEAVPS